jgi:hypothetical protein
MSPLSDPPTSIVGLAGARLKKMEAHITIVWQYDQLRTMKVGGNESATKYFRSNGGSAALASKDPKVKYTSNAATKYKAELERRVAADKNLYVH